MSTAKNETNELIQGLTKAEHFFEKNRNLVLGLMGGIALLIVGVVYLKKEVLPAREEAAQKDLFMAQMYFDKDSFQYALNGDGKSKGFLYVIDNHSFTDAKNLAQYQAGICYLRLGKLDDAISQLKSFSTSQPELQAMAFNALGDAHSEKGEMSDAVSSYGKAAHATTNKVLAPTLLLKAGQALEANNDKEAAAKLYQEIKLKYPLSEESREIDKYIARAGGDL